ncbi:MAG TPA: TIGR03435 family protein [Bryobacteraceae bacterium]
MKTRVSGRFVAIMAFASGLASAQTLAFEVASIRQASPPTLEALRAGQFHSGARIEGTHLDFGYISLWELLPYAFGVREFQIVRPEWTRDSTWNIMANLPEGTSKEQAPDMMHALLTERFKLASRHEKREQQVYQLVVAAGGLKVEASNPGDFKIWDGVYSGFDFGGLLRGDVVSGRILEQPNCGMRWEFVPLPMSAFVDALTMFLDKPVIDETKLKGDYKVYLDINVETMTAMDRNRMRGRGLPAGGSRGGRSGGDGKQGPGPGGPAPPPPPPPGSDPRSAAPLQGLGKCLEAAGDSDGSLSMLFKAVQKLGLNLQQTRAPIETIVVDNLARMSTEN